MSLLEKNNLAIGAAIGLISPLLGFGLVFLVFGLMTHLGIMDEAGSSASSQRFRTMALLAICTNIFWIRKMNQSFTIQTLRGIILVTMVLCSIWFFQYFDALYATDS